MVGNEAATTWMSSIAMNIPTHIRTKPNQVATRACVVLQTVAVPAGDADFSMLRKRDCGRRAATHSRPGSACTPPAHQHRHGRACPGHLRLALGDSKDVDARAFASPKGLR